MGKLRNIEMATLLFILPFACTSINPAVHPDMEAAAPQSFSHGEFGWVLQRFVDELGMVDYGALSASSEHIERYIGLLSRYSPDSHSELFPNGQSRLAYWINAYNAAVIKMVLTYYPISSVLDVKPPFPLFFMPDKSGFFLFQQMQFGGRAKSLYSLENGIIRKRFADPRIHFALNCASRACPRLPKRPFIAEHLDGQLDHETRRFLAEERNLSIDHKEKTILLSSIFKWYERDFLKWYGDRFPQQESCPVRLGKKSGDGPPRTSYSSCPTTGVSTIGGP
jgi:hypothetical protein